MATPQNCIPCAQRKLPRAKRLLARLEAEAAAAPNDADVKRRLLRAQEQVAALERALATT
jgi:hypothetical protein